MSHPILFGVVAALIVSRLMFRLRMRRYYGRRACGGGCGSWRHGGPVDLGAPDGFDAWDRHGRHHRQFARWARRWRREEAFAPATPPVATRTVDVVGALELNQRQREIYDEVIVSAKTRLAAPELAEALSILAREPFDRPALEFLVGKSELADDFEHLHHSLTAEQRAKLRDVTTA
jgi:hypothetical protein